MEGLSGLYYFFCYLVIERVSKGQEWFWYLADTETYLKKETYRQLRVVVFVVRCRFKVESKQI